MAKNGTAKAKQGKRKNDYSATKMKRSLKKSGIVVSLLLVVGVCLAAFSHFNQIEQDLSVIGNGTPTLVQVHDPNCPNCAQLKRNLDSVKSAFSDSIQFKIATLANHKGKAFAAKHNVPKTTLLLFNKHGRLVQTMRGVSSKDEIRNALNKLKLR